MKKIRILFNPKAGSGLAPKIAKLVDASGLAEKYEVETIQTEYAGHGTILAKEAADNNYHSVIAIGGDGTVNEVARSLVHSETALGVIPAGSGNGLAKHIGMKSKATDCFFQLLNAEIKSIDTLKINEHFGLNVSGFGFDGYVAWLFNKSPKRGLSTYTKIGLQEYFKYPSIEFTITIDEKPFTTNAHMLVIANASQFGNAAIIAPKASLEDSLIDLVAVKKPNFAAIPETMIRLFTGTLKDNKYIKTTKCKSFVATADRPVHLHVDGEAIDPLNKITVELFPLSLKVMMPKL